MSFLPKKSKIRKNSALKIKLVIYIIGIIATIGGSTRSVASVVDLLVIGGGASGVSAGVQASRMGTNTLIIEETPWVGGMLTSAGVSAIDGNYNLRAGIWGEFLDSLANYYGGLDSLKTGWVSNVQFEPSVGNKILKNIISKEKNLRLINNTSLISLGRYNGLWYATLQDNAGNNTIVTAKLVIDATELGDVAKMVGVKYDIGMESRKDTDEDIAPEKANNIVQDLTYVAVLKDYGKDSSIAKPEGYDSTRFACSAVNDLCINPKEPERMWSKDMMITYGKLPNNKYMINWPIEGNDYYINLIEMSREQREEALKNAKNFTMCFLYFIQNELGFKNLALADDEFPTVDKLPMIPYHRESRRIHGLVRFKLNDITNPYDQPTSLYRTCVAVGDYPVDHHHTRYAGYENLPNLYFHAVPSFGLPLGTLIPKDVDNFIVAEKSISVSNIMNGTTRLQPVVIQIGQAAGTLASLALQQNKAIKDVRVRDVQREILEAGGYLLPYLDVKKDDIMFKPLQRIGSTGILRGTGMNVEWSNQTWIYADSLLKTSDLKDINEIYHSNNNLISNSASTVKVKDALMLIENIAIQNGMTNGKIENMAKAVWKKYHFGKYNKNANIKRGEFAVLVDTILDPFNRKEVSITGEFLN